MIFSNSATTLPERSLHSKLAVERMGSPKLCLPSLSLKIVPFPCWIPGGASSKEHACQCRILTMRIAGHSNPLQYSCLENPMNKGARQAIVDRVAQNQTRLKLLSTQKHTHITWGKQEVQRNNHQRALSKVTKLFQAFVGPKSHWDGNYKLVPFSFYFSMSPYSHHHTHLIHL